MSKIGGTKKTTSSTSRRTVSLISKKQPFSSKYMSEAFVLRINEIVNGTMLVDTQEKKLTTEITNLYMHNPNVFETTIATDKKSSQLLYKLAWFYHTTFLKSDNQMHYYYAFEYYKLFAVSHIVELYKKPHKDRMDAFIQINTISSNTTIAQGPLFIALDYVIAYYGNTENSPTTINYISTNSHITKLKICFLYVLYNFTCNTTGITILNQMAIQMKSELDQSKKTYKKMLDSIGIKNVEPRLITNPLSSFEQFKNIQPLVIADIIPEVIDEQNFQNAVAYILQNSKTVLRPRHSKLL